MNRIILFVLMLICTSAGSQAQENETKLPELNFLLGNWTVTTETRLSAQGPWETNKGESTITKETGNSLIEANLSSTLKQKSIFYKSLFAYDHFKKKFQLLFIDSEHGLFVDYEGVREADSVTFDKTWVYGHGGTVKLRVVFKIISPDEFTVQSMRMQNTDYWDVTGRMRYARRK